MKFNRLIAFLSLTGSLCISCVSTQNTSYRPERWPQANNQALSHGVVTIDDPSNFSNVFVINSNLSRQLPGEA